MTKNVLNIVFAIATLSIMTFQPIKAQFIEDALRYSGSNNFITPRAAGLNVAYLGIADDVAALIVNPAGLTLIGKNELSAGFGFTHNVNDLNALDIKSTFKVNNEFLSHIAIAAPIKTENGFAAVSVGYFKENDFRNSYEFSGFNDKSSFIAEQAANRQRWVYDLLLANEHYQTPITRNLQQSSWVDERGGLHNITGGAAFDVNEFVSLGFAITGKWGTFDYRREYSEVDVLNLYNTFEVDDFHRLDMRENLLQEVSGISGSIGMQGKIYDFMRLGVSIRMPTWYEVNEVFSRRIDVEFDPNPNGIVDRFDDYIEGKNSYNIRTPFIYGAGFSFNVLGLTFSAGVEYSDVTQLEFSDATEDVQEKLDLINRIAIRELVGQTTWGFGAEYKIPTMPFIARASYAKTTSPYQIDVPNANKSYFSLGGSLILGANVRIDGIMRWLDVSEQRTTYGTSARPDVFSKYTINYQPLNIALGITYRY